ncbi:VOC family protein [Actinocorallia aurea]
MRAEHREGPGTGRLDHLVVAGPDLAEAVAWVEDALGTPSAEGGAHPGIGTRNRLIGLGGGGYLEVIGPDPAQPAPGSPRPFGIDALDRPRLVGWAWAVPSGELADRAARAAAAGFDPGPPRAMSRRTPSGALVSWRLTPLRAGLLPFLIDWEDSPHPSEGLPGVALRSLELLTPEPGAIASGLAALGARADVRQASHPALVAHLTTPAGAATLT